MGKCLGYSVDHIAGNANPQIRDFLKFTKTSAWLGKRNTIFFTFSFQHAAELIKTVAARYDEYVNVKDFSDKISRALTAAKKDNDFIYHDRVPDLKDLDPVSKATLVKSTPVSVPISQKFTGMSRVQMQFILLIFSPV